MTIYPGTRRPLLYSAGGVAILMALPRREAAGIVRRNLTAISHYTGTLEGIREMLRRSLREGIAVNEGQIVPGLTGIGLALCDASGQPFGSLSIAGPHDLVRADRLDEYRAMFEETARQLWARPYAPKAKVAEAVEQAVAARV